MLTCFALVVGVKRYQAKYEKDIECGGGYVKVGPKLSDPKAFGDPTPYNIMFGPDKCGYTKRTHLIFNYKGKNVLKKSDLAYKQEGEGTSHVHFCCSYTCLECTHPYLLFAGNVSLWLCQGTD